MYSLPTSLVLFVAGLFVGTTHAIGAGANVFGCVFLMVPPEHPLPLDYIAGSDIDTCMRNEGRSYSGNVSHAGLVCNYVGYVEEDDSYECSQQQSKWELGYKVGTYERWTKSTWASYAGDNYFSLVDYAEGTEVCNQPSLCGETKMQWSADQTGSLYVIFKPDIDGQHDFSSLSDPSRLNYPSRLTKQRIELK